MLAPEWVIAGTREVRLVPWGTVTLMFVPFITPVAAGSVKLKALIVLAELRATVTVTVYAAVLPSSAVTV
jgi:hypothetical protein